LGNRQIGIGPTIRAALCADFRGVYSGAMELVLPILVAIGMLATLGTLLLGIVTMAKGGNPQRSNRFMRYRIWLQGGTLLLFVIFMMLYRR